MLVTHEQFVQSVRSVVLEYAAISAEERKQLAETKLIYGVGQNCIRGITCYHAWHGSANETVIEIGASAEEHWIQLAGTTIHELAHALSGTGQGHNKLWKQNAARLGLRLAKAAGQSYELGYLAAPIRNALWALPKPEDGKPTFSHRVNLVGIELPKIRPCSAGVGTRGGKSRGIGSGSRLRKFTCSCVPPLIIRASRDESHATCDCCGKQFERAD